MKYLLVALVVFVAIGIWRSKHRKAQTPPVRQPSRTRKPEDMVTCAHCGLHLPASDAVHTQDQLHYCSREHRQLGPH